MCLHNLRILVVLSAIATLVACKATETSLSTARMDRPEVSSQSFDTRLSAGVGFRSSIDLTGQGRQSISFIPPAGNIDSEVDLSAVPLELDLAAIAKLSFTVAPRLELGYSTHDDNKLLVKYQFYGDTADKALAGNYSQAISLGFAIYDDSINDSVIGTSNLVSETGEVIEVTDFRSFEQKTYAIDFAWIHGYRFSDNFLVYGGPYLIYGKLSGEQITTITDITDPTIGTNLFIDPIGIKTDLDSSGKMFGLNLAAEYEFDFGLFVTLEISQGRIDWNGATATDTSTSMLLGYHF